MLLSINKHIEYQETYELILTHSETPVCLIAIVSSTDAIFNLRYNCADFDVGKFKQVDEAGIIQEDFHYHELMP